jgi:hypothetical protein
VAGKASVAVAGAAVWEWRGRLCIDDDGVLWTWLDRPGRAGWLYHGPHDDHDVPPDLAADAAELADLWRDAHGSLLASTAGL